jgi:uncharacterized protein YndB with AHSA1/START domain
MSDHSLIRASFNVERTFQANIGRVFKAFSDKESKELWFKGPKGQESAHHMDFRVGGLESNEGKFHDGVTHRFVAKYYDIVPNERIIYTYEMYLDGKRISVSLATIELIPQDDNSTKLLLSEDGVFLDGLDTARSREMGTNYLLDSLENSLKEG